MDRTFASGSGSTIRRRLGADRTLCMDQAKGEFPPAVSAKHVRWRQKPSEKQEASIQRLRGFAANTFRQFSNEKFTGVTKALLMMIATNLFAFLILLACLQTACQVSPNFGGTGVCPMARFAEVELATTTMRAKLEALNQELRWMAGERAKTVVERIQLKRRVRTLEDQLALLSSEVNKMGRLDESGAAEDNDFYAREDIAIGAKEKAAGRSWRGWTLLKRRKSSS